MKLLATLTLTVLTLLSFHSLKAEARAKCAEFSSQEEAQAYMQKNGAGYLDRDKDGVACETLPRHGGVIPKPSSSAKSKQPPKPTIAAIEQATVISTGDGDTLRINQQGKPITVRIACMDAPETAQKPWGAEAATRFRQLLPVGQIVKVRVINRDRYGRTVAEIFTGDQPVGLTMVRDGMAVVYPQYINNCAVNKSQYLQAEASAKQAQRGVWSDPKFVMPWEFRRGR